MKIGIITLHRVRNYGSALQAYALQEYIEKEGLGQAELIDYVYPNPYHRSRRNFSTWLRNLYCVQIRDEFFRKGWMKGILFRHFYRDFYHLSACQYKSIESIRRHPPVYDLYMSGSDQLWNVNTLKNDPVMYCEFAPEGKRRVSFGASFTLRELPRQYHASVRERLAKYSHIGVREYSSLEILNQLRLDNQIEKACTCDPTLLLNAHDYEKLSSRSRVQIDGDFVLVYTLKYAFNPEPALNAIVEEVRRKTGLKFVIIDSHKVKLNDGDKIISGIGPNEFCWLFAHAKFVIASSFHGTMFSIINRCPFAVIGPPAGNPDRRIGDILGVLGLDAHYFPSDRPVGLVSIQSPYTSDIERKIDTFIESSKAFLSRAIDNGQIIKDEEYGK